MSKVNGSSKQFVLTFKRTVTVTTKYCMSVCLMVLNFCTPRKYRFTSITFFAGCSAVTSFSPSSFSLVIVASLGSRHLLIKFCQRDTQLEMDEQSRLHRGWSDDCSLCVHLLSYLILLLAGRIVQVCVTPIVVDSLLCLLVHPVQLIGAILHIVPQSREVSLTSRGIGLIQKKALM